MDGNKRITYIYSYYENPEMFKIHQNEWMNYPKELLSRMEFIVVDDCSPEHHLENNIIVSKKFPLRGYRITKKVNWNWRCARNIGAYESKLESWLLLTDIDHLVPLKTLAGLFKMIDGKVSVNHYYILHRVIAPDLVPYKNHPNTYFIPRSMYLAVGGYDEVASGAYGLDGTFRRRLERTTRGAVQLKYNVHLYQRDYVADASLESSVMPRKENRDERETRYAMDQLKKRFLGGIRPDVCTFPYKQVWP